MEEETGNQHYQLINFERANYVHSALILVLYICDEV